MPSDSSASLWPEERQRLHVGLRLFPAALGAQEELSRLCDADGALRVIVTYRGSDEAARLVATSLEDVGEVQGRPLKVLLLPIAELDAKQESVVAGIFIASVGLEPNLLGRLSARHRTLVFSPFAGDVAAGAVAGIHVADRILPAVNLQHARRAGVRFEPFFLRVAHRVE
jgi:hypothetical protein